MFILLYALAGYIVLGIGTLIACVKQAKPESELWLDRKEEEL